ncbi:hypothetical protein [Helicobacter ibis]|uniref:Uncharacterized protein n=1 Tax=Helicobacter ibis TaxID=2962633 RepID=A0ABT4VCR8_9HELI|nr:hypothetical protein [Helicobacter ibis]MDA3968498.1 hypothetical protein [Helicobacter ibis]
MEEASSSASVTRKLEADIARLSPDCKKVATFLVKGECGGKKIFCDKKENSIKESKTFYPLP